MTTGYTAIIEDNPETVTFRQYALRCARAMGACIMQRDDPMDDPPKADPARDSYYSQQIAACTERLASLRSMNEAAKQTAFDAECARVTADNTRYAAEHARKQAAYARIRAEVSDYRPPTPEHDGYKRFMLEQIDICYKPDAEPFTQPMPTSAEAHHALMISTTKASLESHKKYAAQDDSCNNGRRKWIEHLYESLPPESPAP